LVPKSPTDYDPRIQAKVDKGDLENMVRLAFIAEALFPGESRVSAASRPEIVRHILELAGEDPYWHPTSARGGVPADGDPFTTAYVLFALRRYEDPRGEFRHYRSWLAQQLKTKSAVRARPDLVALIGLALIPDGVDPEEPAAIDQCKEELAAWSGRETIVLNRPLFHGFNLGEWTDYTFLHPEIVAALFLLRAGNPRSTRRYVAKVVGEVVENVKSHGYFEGQPGMGATVDQFWASKLLAEFQQINADPTRRQILLPVTVIRGWMRWLVVAVAAPIFALVVVFTSNPAWGAVGAVVGGVVIPMLINIIVNWAGNS
jgi:hypothetical protein